MLSFISGAPKSGKTEEIIHRITEDIGSGNKVLLLVPEQEAVSAERRIIDSLGASPNMFLLEVANFSRLSNIVFRALGGLCYNYIDKGGQAVIMWRVLSELSAGLNNYKVGESTDAGLVASLISLYSQLADYRVTPEKFERAAVALPESLRAKAEDLALIYTRYDALVHENFDSSKDDLFKVAELIHNKGFLSDTKIYIDSFSGFTPAEFEVIRALISIGASVTISLCIDKTREMSIFENLSDIEKQLSEYAQNSGIEIAKDFTVSRKRNSEFEFFAEKAYDPVSKEFFTQTPEHVHIVLSPDIYTECELICADIAKQIKLGMRYRDIAVIASDATEYFGILDVMLKRHNMPCRFSVSRDILQSRCVKFIICALNIIIYNWRLDDVVTYLKTGLCPINDEECDIIEEYASTWSLSGSVWKMEEDWGMNPDGYSSGIGKENALLLCRLNDIRNRLREPVLELSEDLKADRSASGCAAAVYKFLTACFDPNSLAGEDIASWNAVITALEQISLCAGGEKIRDIETLKRLIRLTASQSSFSLIPATVDEITVYSISSIRSVSAKKIYIIGANEGSYPCRYSESNILDDRLRQALCEAKLILPHDPYEMNREQIWLFYKAFLSAEDSVWISRYTGTLDGRSIGESEAVFELKKLFPKIGIKEYKDFDVSELVYDRVCAFDLAGDEKYGNTVCEFFSDDEEYKRILEGFETPVSTRECTITNKENLSCFKGDMSFSQTRLESFIKCKFAYQLSYNLKLREQRKVNYDPRDIGNFIHKVLEDYFRAAKDKKLDPKESKLLVDNIVDRYITDICGTMTFVSKRLLALFEKLRRNAHLFIRSINEEFENSDFKPKFFEMTVSNKDDAELSPYKILLSDGSKIYINGQIDRVDTFERDGKLYFRVVDYKTGSKAFKAADLERGINLQMFLYLFSIMENADKFRELLGCEGELIPAAVIYYLAKFKPSNHNEKTDICVLEREILDSIERQGMLLHDETVISAMAKQEDDKVIPVNINLKKGTGHLYTLESLGMIQGNIEDVIIKIAEAVKRGESDAIPCEFDDPCRYCSHYSVCRIDKEGGESDE